MDDARIDPPPPPDLPGGEPREVAIREETIRLGQLLKLAGLAGSGGDARTMLEAGAVTVNGEPESRRGRRLRGGDVVALGGDAVRVA